MGTGTTVQNSRDAHGDRQLCREADTVASPHVLRDLQVLWDKEE